MKDTAEYPNFYENLEEAHKRILSTVVLYDKEPYIVQAVTAHRDDGVFRVYLMPLGYEPNYDEADALPSFSNHPRTSPALGTYLDSWMEKKPKQTALIRKKMDSSYFNKFRPFPLGMCQVGKQTYYCERQPMRPRGEQGLSQAMVSDELVQLMPSINLGRGGRYGNVSLYSKELRDCILGKYLPADEALSNLLDPDVENYSLPFHRQFAFIRGPLGTIWLAYKADVVGLLPNADLSEVRLGPDFKYVAESVAELGVFNNIVS